MPRPCTICGIRLCPNDGTDTCGLSECQEAAYYRNLSKNVRRGTRKWREAFALAEQKRVDAMWAAMRRGGQYA